MNIVRKKIASIDWRCAIFCFVCGGLLSTILFDQPTQFWQMMAGLLSMSASIVFDITRPTSA